MKINTKLENPFDFKAFEIETLRCEVNNMKELNEKLQAEIEELKMEISRIGTDKETLNKEYWRLRGWATDETNKYIRLHCELTDDEIKAYRLIDNKIAESEWDMDLLGMDLEGFEFDFDSFNIEFKLSETLEEGLTDSDAVPDIDNENVITQKGDVWILGNHRLMCGDSTIITHVDKLLNGQEPNTMITDPPYGVQYEAGWRGDMKGRKKTEREKNSTIQNDDNADWYDAYALHKGNVAYVWHASAFTDVVMEGLRKAGFEIKAQIIWNKNVHALSRSDYQWKHEPCWYAVRKGAKHNWVGDRKQKTIWDIDNVMFEKDGGGKTAHPTQKPVEIYVRAILNHTNSGEYIYEPFGGSGTSIIAAEKTNRRSITMELDEKYCDVIIKRWEQFTGNKAALVEGTRKEEVIKFLAEVNVE